MDNNAAAHNVQTTSVFYYDYNTSTTHPLDISLFGTNFTAAMSSTDYAAFASDDHSAQLYRIKDAKCSKLHELKCGKIHAMTFSPDGEYLIVQSKHDTIIWTMQAKASRAMKRTDLETNFTFSPDNDLLAIADWHSVNIKNMSSELQPTQKESNDAGFILLSPLRDRFLLGSESEISNIFGALSQTPELKVTLDLSHVRNLKFSGGGGWLALRDVDNFLSILDLQTRTRVVFADRSDSEQLELSYDGKLLATFDRDSKSLRIWTVDIQSLLCIMKLSSRPDFEYFQCYSHLTVTSLLF